MPINPYSDKLCLKENAIMEQVAALELYTHMSSNAPILKHPFFKIRSICHLYEICLQEHQFVLAESVYRLSRKEIRWTAPSLVKPMFFYVTGSNVKPKSYLFILTDVIFPNLVVNDGIVSRLKSWTCRVADTMDESNEEDMNLAAALVLLETVDSEMRKLQLRIHSSFGSYSPFTDRTIDYENRAGMRRKSPKTNISLEKSDTPSFSGESTFSNNGSFPFSSSSKRKSSTGSSVVTTGKSIPTILELSALQRGLGNATSGGLESYDCGDDECVQEKLLHAKCLLVARNLGLTRDITSLRDFSSNGGSQYIAKELVRHFSSSATTHEVRMEVLKERVLPFCEQYSVKFDQAVHDCAVGLCGGSNFSVESIEECCSIARCCSSPIIKCEITLVILRASLFCGCTNMTLYQLAKDAITLWASCYSSLRSELQEALRLLQIDGIIVRYCGSGARELFRVENSRHSIRLLDFVTQHVEHETVVDDTLSLCDGFNHLCPYSASRKLLENSILHQDGKISSHIFEKLIKKDSTLAESALVGAVLFSEAILDECSNSIRSGCQVERIEQYRERARCVSSRMGVLILCAMESSLSFSQESAVQIDCYFENISFTCLRDTFLRIERLQSDFSVFVSMEAMSRRNEIINIVTPFVESLIPSYGSRESESLQRNLTKAKRICSLLTTGSKVDGRDAWAAASAMVALKMVKERKEGNLLQFLSDVGLLADVHDCVLTQAYLSVVVGLCEATMNGSAESFVGMKRMVIASSLMKHWSMLTSKGKDLSITIALACRLEIICQVFARCDEGTGEAVESLRREIQARAWSQRSTSTFTPSATKHYEKLAVHRPVLHPSWYTGDGILLPPVESLVKCILFWNWHGHLHRGADDGTTDLFELVNSRGAHSLALRILCESSCLRTCIKIARNDDAHIAGLQDALDETMKALAERSLGGTGTGITNAVIDSQQAAVFLWLLPLKQAFATYKCCLPTAIKIQSFERLLVLSNIGMIAGSGDLQLGTDAFFILGWKKQKKFFDQCQRLATKAKWWSILRQHGVEFDSNRFHEPVSHEEANTDDRAVQAETSYSTSLLHPLFMKISQTLSSDDVISLSLNFADTFGLPYSLAVSKYVEFLLSPSNNDTDDSYYAGRCDETIREVLQLLLPPSKRSAILRRCLKNLECMASFRHEYELYSLVLKLYHETLIFAIDNDRNIPAATLEAELEAIDRRRDAMAILSAFFQGDRLTSRPRFSSFFLSLPESVGHFNATSSCGILGKRSHDGDDMFDPLEELEKVLTTSHDIGAVTALAPLCIPLGIPNGYIHARSLIARFNYSKSNFSGYPSVDSDIVSILNRVGSSRERGILAEWCANQYKNEGEKLKCLEVVCQCK
jgi:hypothetical protein